MQADLTSPIPAASATKIRVIQVNLFRQPGGGLAGEITLEAITSDGDTVIRTVTVHMRPATLSALFGATAFRAALKADIEAALGQSITGVTS